jgi:hypothetical protein
MMKGHTMSNTDMGMYEDPAVLKAIREHLAEQARESHQDDWYETDERHEDEEN